jgi:drug/metabolite transporter (DMT)-like permease
MRMQWSSVSTLAWASVFYAGVLSIGVAYIIWYYGVSRLGNTRTSTYSNVVPVFAMIVAWIWLGEVPAATQLIGTVVILSGVSIAQTA